ncbi:SPOR domain-containing protein, partial [Coralloluteibacterium thermophilus]
PPVQAPPTAVAAAPALPPPATASAVDLSPAAEIAELPPAPLPSPAPPAPPLPQVPAGATAWLQVGSFAERANADTAARRLREAGLGGIEIAPVDVAGRAYWRVRLGPLAADAAAEAAARVTALGLGQPRVALD